MTRRALSHRDTASYVLAGCVVVGFFGVLAIMLIQDRPGADILVGALGGAFGAVIGYYYGSTAGSARKTELLAQAPPVSPGGPEG